MKYYRVRCFTQMRNLKEEMWLHILNIFQQNKSHLVVRRIARLPKSLMKYFITLKKSQLLKGKKTWEKCSPIDEFEREGPQLDDNLGDTPTSFESIVQLILECASSCHETKYSEVVESLKDHLHHMYETNLIEDQILKHLEESIVKVIIGVLHHEMMVMSGPQ